MTLTGQSYTAPSLQMGHPNPALVGEAAAFSPLGEGAHPTFGNDKDVASGAAESWGDQLRALHAPLIGSVAADANRLASRNREAGFGVVVSTEDPTFVSEALARILRECYGGTFPIRQFTDAKFVQSQMDANMITSFVLRDEATGGAVGTSSLRHLNADEWRDAYRSGAPIGVELARSASLPSQAAATELMQARQLHVFENNAILTTHAYVFGDARTSTTRTLPNGEELTSGARTQHSIWKNGLRPTYLHASYDFRGLHEPMLVYALTFDREGQQRYLDEHPVYLPANADGLRNFVADTMDLTGLRVQLMAGHGRQHSDAKLAVKSNGVYLEGEMSDDNSGHEIVDAAALTDEPGAPDALLVKVAATEGNLAFMNQLVGAGFTATGIVPGTSTKLIDPDGRAVPYVQESRVIFVKNRKGTLANAPELELPRDMDGHRINQSIQHLWHTIRERNA